MPCSTADAIRGSAAAVVVGVWSTLVPAAELPHQFGYYAAAAAFLLGVRFGVRATGMLFVCCIAVAVAGATAGRGACTPSSDHVTCAFDAAEPFLIFGYFIGPTIVGAVVSGSLRMSKIVLTPSPGKVGGPRERVLLPGHTIVIATAAATTAFIGLVLLSLPGGHLFFPALAACVAFGLAPSYSAENEPASAKRVDDVPSW